MRIEEGNMGKRVMVIAVQRRRKGRQKWRWTDNMKDNLREKELLGHEA